MAITPTPTFSLNERKKSPHTHEDLPHTLFSGPELFFGDILVRQCESELGLTLTYPVLAFLLRRGSKTCTARPCNDYLALGAEEGTGRSPDASPVLSVPMVQDRQRRAEARRGAASAGQSSSCELALLRSTADLRGQACWGTALRGTEQSAALVRMRGWWGAGARGCGERQPFPGRNNNNRYRRAGGEGPAAQKAGREVSVAREGDSVHGVAAVSRFRSPRSGTLLSAAPPRGSQLSPATASFTPVSGDPQL